MRVAGEARLARSREPEEEKSLVAQAVLGSDADYLGASVQAEAAALLHPVHELPQHGLLVLAFVVGPEDDSEALLGKDQHSPLLPFRDGDGDEVRILVAVLRLEEGVAPHQRDAGEAFGDIYTRLEPEIGVQAHDAVELDHLAALHVFKHLVEERFGLNARLLAVEYLGKLGAAIAHLRYNGQVPGLRDDPALLQSPAAQLFVGRVVDYPLRPESLQVVHLLPRPSP